MNNIKDFESFRNEKLNQELNEGLFQSLQNIWKFFKGVSKTLQTSIGNFTKKLENSKDWNNTLSVINSDVIQANTKYFEDSMKNATTVSQIRKINYEVHLSTFTELNATYKRWDSANPKSPISPSQMFVGTPFATMYNYVDTENFRKDLTNSINGLISTYAKKTGYPIDDVTKSINDYKDLSQNPPQENTNSTNTTNPPVDNAPVPAESTTNVNASYIISFQNFNKIFEVDTTNQQTNQQEQQPNTDQGQPIDKLKTENITNFKNNFYGLIQKKLKAFKPANPKAPTPEAQKGVDGIVNKMSGSGKNVDAKKKLLNTITDPKLTADQLNKVRDAIAPILQIKDPVTTIGDFNK